jgi:hypothetical protein
VRQYLRHEQTEAEEQRLHQDERGQDKPDEGRKGSRAGPGHDTDRRVTGRRRPHVASALTGSLCTW